MYDEIMDKVGILQNRLTECDEMWDIAEYFDSCIEDSIRQHVIDTLDEAIVWLDVFMKELWRLYDKSGKEI